MVATWASVPCDCWLFFDVILNSLGMRAYLCLRAMLVLLTSHSVLCG